MNNNYLKIAVVDDHSKIQTEGFWPSMAYDLIRLLTYAKEYGLFCHHAGEKCVRAISKLGKMMGKEKTDCLAQSSQCTTLREAKKIKRKIENYLSLSQGKHFYV